MKMSTLIKIYRYIPAYILIILSLLFAVQAWGGNQTTSSTLASSIIDQARKYLNDSTSYGGTQASIWSDSEMLQWVNDGTLDIVSRTHCLEDTETEVLVENQAIYALGDPFIIVKYVIYNNDFALDKGSIGEFNRVGSASVDGAPTHWCMWENNLIVYPAPDSTTVTAGSEKVLDSDFTYSTDWTWGTGWAHDATNDEADATASDADLEQDVSAIAGESYFLTWTLKNFSSGSVQPIVGGTSGTAKTANGTYSEYILAISNGNLKFDATAFTGSIDDASVKKVANITAYVVDRPTDVAGGAAVLVPAQYDKALVYYVVGQAWAKDDRLDQAAAFANLYLQELERYRTDLTAQPAEK